MPRANFNAGVTSLTGLNGQEYIGLSLLSIIALPGMLGDIKLEKQFSKLLWMGISLYQWQTAASVSISDMEIFRRCSQVYVKTYNDVAEEQRLRISPMVGNKFPKLHGLLKGKWKGMAPVVFLVDTLSRT